MKINGTIDYPWRAVDQHGNVLDVLVQSRRIAKAAKRFFRKLLKGLPVCAAGAGDRQARQLRGRPPRGHALCATPASKYLNNRAENSHQPTRQRERAMKRFKSARHAQRFLSAFSGISPHLGPARHLLSATGWRHEMADRFTVWNQITGVATTAA